MQAFIETVTITDISYSPINVFPLYYQGLIQDFLKGVSGSQDATGTIIAFTQNTLIEESLHRELSWNQIFPYASQRSHIS